MQDFGIQVLATLVSTLIIFAITKLWRFLKRISIKTWHKMLIATVILFTYLININNIVVHLKLLIEATNFNFKYVIVIISLSLCFFTTVDLSVFIKNEFNKRK